MKAALLAAGLLAWTAGAVQAQGQLLVISGVGGEPRFSEMFRRQAATLVTVAQARFGMVDSQVHWFSEHPELDPGVAQGRSTRESIEQAFASLGRSLRPGDQATIVLVGHGSMQGDDVRFNLPGPDMSPADFARLVAALGPRPVAFIDLSSASGEFLRPLAARGRVVVTATKTGFERNEVQFGGYFVQAFSGDGADTDKDGVVSLVEAFQYAVSETARAYEQSGQLQTEHAQLDDNGDGQGSAAPTSTGPGDGVLAATMSLAPRVVASQAGDPVLDSLVRRKTGLEQAIATLRQARDTMETSRYEDRLEALVLQLAEVNRGIARREARQ